ncbi:hypothetical protein [Vacuolonema iberomarrocanum]|uniref:hypothetical protein n=1 Tax=Vacuolonema iberomarrocanum TaxID=3454632 RepID=UPI0019F91645|nr:hypothetical protein [filamentous cyanobacterium LEGE 07170]
MAIVTERVMESNVNLDRARQQEVRFQLLKILDRQRPSPTSEAVVLRTLHQAGLRIARQVLLQELNYLKGKELVANHEILWKLLPLGVDVLEHNVDPIPGIPVNGGVAPEVRAFRQEVRGRLLMALYYARPHGAGASLLWRALDDSELRVSETELSREAFYLQGKGLITIEGKPKENWKAELSVNGQDVMEYTTPAPPGVHLVDKYWEL